MHKLAILAGTLVLAACGSGNDSAEEDSKADSTAGGSTIRVTNADGEQAVINSGAGVKADLPDGFTTYPGAKVVTASNISTADGEGSVLFMTTGDSPEKVAAHYRKEAEAAGVKIGLETSSDSMRMIAGEAPDGKSFSMTATTQDEGTAINLMVGSKPGG